MYNIKQKQYYINPNGTFNFVNLINTYFLSIHFLNCEQIIFFYYNAVLIEFLKHARLASLRLTAAEVARILTMEQRVVNLVIVRDTFVT